MNRRTLLLFLLGAKLAAGVIAWHVVGGTIRLGDTTDYLSGVYLSRQDPLSTAYLMSLTGSWFTSTVGYTYFANVPMLILAWVGIVKGTQLLELGRRYWLLLFVSLLAPSYQLWTSLHSKEAVVNLCFGWIVFYTIARHKGIRLGLAERVTTATMGVVLVLFKPAYAPALVWLFLFMPRGFVRSYPKLASTLVLVLGLSVAAGILVVLRDLLDLTAQTFHLHFSAGGTFTRGRSWSGIDQLLRELPLGVVVSFVGPTLSEAMGSARMIPFFLEGVAVFSAVVYLMGRGTLSGGGCTSSVS